MKPHSYSSIFKRYQSESPVSTELRRVYHNMKKSPDGKHPKTFMLTSPTRGEGKSTVASYLAVTIAQFPKKRVLLIDADLRRPRQHRIFDVGNEVGLKDCLESDLDPIKACQQTELANLQVMTAGSHAKEPGRLFESEALAEVINKVAFYNDIVLVDTAPVLAVSDTLFFCPVIDSVLLLVLAGVTPREVVTRAKNVLVDSGATIGGVLLNNASQVLPYYYDSKYYGYSGGS